MYGWRGRIAAILGRPNTVCEPEFNKMVPEGVSVHGARLSGHSIAVYNDPKVMEEMEQIASKAAADLSGLQPTVVVFTHHAAGVATVDFNEKITKVMASQAGCQALTTGTAVVQALKAVGAKKIGLADPFPKSYLTEIVQGYLEHPDIGFQVVNKATARGNDPNFITNMPPSVSYQIGRQADHSEADTILLAANVWRTLESIEPLEQDLGKPVITANQATVWAALKMMGVAADKRFGSLFDH
jgi:maleate isomerase